MRVATICGSHHSESTNAVVIATIASRLVAGGVTIERIDTSTDLPAFRPEAVDDPPAGVEAIRAAFCRADGVVFAIPEYAGGLPGWVKNITDWMVRPAALYERPAVVVSAATMGGALAIQQLATTLTWQGAYVVATCGLASPLTMVRNGAISDAAVVARLDRIADVLQAVMRGELSAFDAAAATLAPLGIDPYVRTT